MKNKIYLLLTGGLGNQLFQYAAARNLSIKNNCELIIDTKSGLLINDIYIFLKSKGKSKFVLNKKEILGLNNNELKKINCRNFILKFFFFKIIKKICKIFYIKSKLLNNFINFLIIDETLLNSFSKKVLNIKLKKDIYLLGYFQSEKYFLENKNIIIKEIFPLKSKNKLFLNMKNRINNCNSVSLAIRSFESEIFETKKFGGIASYEFYTRAIDLILKEVSNPNFFFFSTNINNAKNILNKIPILNKYKFAFITSDLGYNDANDTLWLMSYCKYHIISNSTLYWWGAYFSSLRYKKNKIICSGNYPNKDTCLNNWKLNNL
jgi:hypothetical protein